MGPRAARVPSDDEVPAAPILEVLIDDADDDGVEEATVDGLRVPRLPGEEPLEAAVRAVSDLVDEVAGLDGSGRRSPWVRVRLVTRAGVCPLVVHRDGRMYIQSVDGTTFGGDDEDAGSLLGAPEPEPEVSPEPRVEPVPVQVDFVDPRTGETTPAPAPAPVPDPGPAPIRVPGPAGRAARLLRGSAEPGAADPEVSPSTAEEPPSRVFPPPRRPGWARRTPPAGRRPSLPRPAVLVVIAAALVVALAAGGIVVGLRRGHEPSPPLTADTRLPGQPPHGWQASSRWASPPLDPAAGPALAVGDAVAYVTTDRRVVLADASSGTPRWSQGLPEGAVVSPLARTTIGGGEVVAVHTTRHLSWWPVAGGQGGSVEVPTGARVTYLGAAPLVSIDERTVAVVAPGGVSRVAVPGGAYALAATAQGTVTAASPAGWWHLTPGAAPPAATAWEDADPDPRGSSARPTVVGYLDGFILTTFPPDRTGTAHVVAFTDEAARVRVAFRAAYVTPAGGPPSWRPSPARTWGVLGRSLVDLQAGSVTDLGPWTTRWVADDRAYGSVRDLTVVAGPEVPRGVVPPGQAHAEVVTPQGAGVRVVRSGEETLLLLPPVL